MDLGKKKKSKIVAKETFHINWWDEYERRKKLAKEKKCEPHELKEKQQYKLYTEATSNSVFPEEQRRRCQGIASIKAQYLAAEAFPMISPVDGEKIEPQIGYDMFCLPFSNTKMTEVDFKKNLSRFLQKLKESAFKNNNARVYPADMQFDVIITPRKVWEVAA